MKVINNSDLFLNSLNNLFHSRGQWEANWICHPDANTDKSSVYGYFLKFYTDKEITIKIHTSADQRYKLYLDNEFIGLGPERGDLKNWFFETYEITLSKGYHTLFVISWYIAFFDNCPQAQVSWHPGFILCTEDLPKEILSTGFAPWKVIDLYNNYKLNKEIYLYTGSRFDYIGKDFPIGFEKGETGNWTEPKILPLGEQKFTRTPGDYYTNWYLRSSMLPLPYFNKVKNITVKFAEYVTDAQTNKLTILSNNNEKICKQFNDLLNNNIPLTVEPNQEFRVLADFNNYYCVYSNIETSKGKDSHIKINYAEGFGIEKGNPTCCILSDKANRDVIENKYFCGYGDSMYPGGFEKESFEPFWWMSGRYVEIYIKTGNEPLIIKNLYWTETHYDYKWEGKFECNDEKFLKFIPLAKRALEMCTHETFMDCPYYEQMMYIGDTRVETLAYYTWEKEHYMPKKTLDMFHKSIDDTYITTSRYPGIRNQKIPTFSLWYIAMIYDYAMWSNDLDFVRQLVPSARSIIEFFLAHYNNEGLLVSPEGWNFIDWPKDEKFITGMTKEADKGISGYYNIHLVYTLDILAKIEHILGETELETRTKRLADELYQITEKTFWDEEKGLFAENKEHDTWLEHSQCIAILSEHGQDKISRIMDSLEKHTDIIRTTIYYSFYLFEASKKANRFDIFDKKISFWSNLSDYGFKTTPEEPEPARSDCHAWGSHPLYHLQSGILGVEPLTPCFNSVKIKPRMLKLKEATGIVPHRLGDIKLEYTQNNGEIHGKITLPQGLNGICEVNNKTIELIPGENLI